MSTVEEIKAAIVNLSFEEKAELAKWLHGWTDDEWDRRMAEDAGAGKLERLVAEVDLDIDGGRLSDLP